MKLLTDEQLKRIGKTISIKEAIKMHKKLMQELKRIPKESFEPKKPNKK